MKCFTIVMFIVLAACASAPAEMLYVDIQKGSDDNPGSLEKPLKTIQKAVELINTGDEPGPSTIKIAAGLYHLEKECLISNQRIYSENERLIIEAMILPDDPNWKPQDMPIIATVENPVAPQNAPYIEASGFKVEISHVTLRGLKFTGTAVPKVLYYPIYREGKSLQDLEISQCVFLCGRYDTSANVAILANGHGVKLDHCIFYQCANAVVFWNAEGGVSRGNAMTHCIIDGGYVSGVWLCQTGEDFQFHHNIMTNCRYAFMRNENNTRTYHISDCIINAFEFYSGKSGPNFELSEAGADMPYVEQNVVKTGDIQLEKGYALDLEIPARYFHVVKGTQGFELGAGLFKKE